MLYIKVLFFDTSKISLECLLNSSFLFDRDIDSLLKYKVEETKKEKACSLIYKNKYVGDYQIDQFGKPISDKTYFNISHSKGAVVFIKDDVPIGIDIEKIRDIDEASINFISSNEEREYIDNNIKFYEIWTNKESLTKCVGTGIKNKIKEIPGLPIDGMKNYQGKKYFSKTIKYKEFIISVNRESEQPFELEIVEERL